MGAPTIEQEVATLQEQMRTIFIKFSDQKSQIKSLKKRVEKLEIRK